MTELFQRTPGGEVPVLPAEGTVTVRGTDGDWQPGGVEGFWIKPLVEDSASGQRTWLMKVDPGASAPLHAHQEIEQIYVLQGAFHDQHTTYHAGDYAVRAPGAMHSAGSRQGALVLLFYSPAPGGGAERT